MTDQEKLDKLDKINSLRNTIYKLEYQVKDCWDEIYYLEKELGYYDVDAVDDLLNKVRREAN